MVTLKIKKTGNIIKLGEPVVLDLHEVLFLVDKLTEKFGYKFTKTDLMSSEKIAYRVLKILKDMDIIPYVSWDSSKELNKLELVILWALACYSCRVLGKPKPIFTSSTKIRTKFKFSCPMCGHELTLDDDYILPSLQANVYINWLKLHFEMYHKFEVDFMDLDKVLNMKNKGDNVKLLQDGNNCDKCKKPVVTLNLGGKISKFCAC